MVRVYGTTRFAMGVRAVIGEDDTWVYTNGKLSNSDQSVEIPAVPSWVTGEEKLQQAIDGLCCVIELDGEYLEPLTSYYTLTGGGHIREHSFT